MKGHTDWVNCVRLGERAAPFRTASLVRTSSELTCTSDMKSRTMFSASDDTTLKLWDLDTRQVLRVFEGHIGHVQQVFDFDEEGHAGADSSSHDNADALSVSSSGRGGSGAAEMASLSPAQPSLSYGRPQAANTSLARMHPSVPTPPHDADDPALLRELYYGPGAASHDPERPLPPRYFVSAGLASTIRLWDSLTRRRLTTFFGHVEGVWALAGNHMRIISGANDSLLKCWDPRTGRCERTFAGPRGPIMSVSLSDSRMACGSEDGEVRIYSFNKGDAGAGSGLGSSGSGSNRIGSASPRTGVAGFAGSSREGSQMLIGP